MDSAKLNGSIDRLASALRDVVREAAGEAIDKGVAPLREDIAGLKTDMAKVRGEVAQIHHKLDWSAGKRAEAPSSMSAIPGGSSTREGP